MKRRLTIIACATLACAMLWVLSGVTKSNARAQDERMCPPDLLAQLRQGVAKLPEKQRMVVILRFQEGLGPAEIAEVLEMPVNTVKSTLHRTLADLRKALTRKIREVRYAFF